MSLETNTIIRPSTPDDLPFIEAMCYQAAFPEGVIDERQPFSEVKELDWFKAYTQDWLQHDGDFGVIAETDGRPIGAAWYRNSPREERIAGVPEHELVMALVPEARGKKIGEKLLVELLEGASERGIDELSLHVKRKNIRAKKLYSAVGFTTVKVLTGENQLTQEVMVAPTSLAVAQ